MREYIKYLIIALNLSKLGCLGEYSFDELCSVGSDYRDIWRAFIH